MNEYTMIYTVEVTEIFKDEKFDEKRNSKEAIAKWFKRMLHVDDVNVKDKKVFVREVSE